MRINKDEIREHIKGTLVETLNITFIESDDLASLEATMPVVHELTQSMGVLHGGGATISLAESLAGIGSNMLCGNDEQCFGMQISASHMSPAWLVTQYMQKELFNTKAVPHMSGI